MRQPSFAKATEGESLLRYILRQGYGCQRKLRRANPSFATSFAKATDVKESYGGRRERCRSGLTGPPGKRVYSKRVPGVRIPLSPQLQITPVSRQADGFLFLIRPSQARLSEDRLKTKTPMSKANLE